MKQLNFLESGNFTGIDSIVLQKAKELEERARESGKSIFLEICKYIHTLPYNPEKFIEFRKRDASEIIESGYHADCTDLALVDLVLLRALDYPAMYVESISNEWLADKSEQILGHVFSKVLVNGNWRLRDPFLGFRPGDQYKIKGKLYTPIAYGLDFSELYTLNDQKVSIYTVEEGRRLIEALNM